MTILKFSLAALAPLYEHAKAAREGRPAYEQMCDPAFLKAGCQMPATGWLTEKEMDYAKIPRCFHLVKDAGIYLMSNGQPYLQNPKDVLRDPTTTHGWCIYAQGYGPAADYDAIRDAVGGDDFVEIIPLDWYEQALANQEDFLQIAFSQNTFQLVTSPKYWLVPSRFNRDIGGIAAGTLAGFHLHQRGKKESVFYRLSQVPGMLEEFAFGEGIRNEVAKLMTNPGIVIPKPKRKTKKTK